MPKTPFIFDPQTIHGNLDERFYRTVNPASFPDHIIRYRNQDAASTVAQTALCATSPSMQRVSMHDRA